MAAMTSSEVTALLSSSPEEYRTFAMQTGNRNQAFTTPSRQPLVNNNAAKLEHVKGPLPFFNPTRAQFAITPDTDLPAGYGSADEPFKAEGAHLAWRARDNRKGRHVLVVPKDHTKGDEPPLTNTWSAVAKGIWRMCTVYAWWDVSWWIAVLFTVGSAIFVICAFFYWLPLAAPDTEFAGEGIAGGVTAFVGATLFTVGGVLLVVEASNDNQTGCFGWALQQVFSHHESDTENENGNDNGTSSSPKVGRVMKIKRTDCDHHHAQGVHRSDALHMQHPDAGRRWEWWPTWYELRTHYIHEIGYMASFILAIGAIIFYVAGIMSLPWIYDASSQGVLWGVYWLTYLLGGVLFVVSSALYMLETQPNWYTPAPRVLGWWIGTFNMIGSIGWTVSASFGYCNASWCVYQSDLSLLWASLAFMFGSMLLWYEALDKYPVVRA